MALMKTMPASSSRSNRARSASVPGQALAPSPKGLSLATLIASSMSLTRNSSATGPKISS